MITIIYSTHKDKEYNDKFKNHLLRTVGLPNPQILEYENHNQYSLSNVYNSGISESNYDIVVCCHNDIKLENNWGKKLLEDFSNNSEFGIIGKAGSCYFPESGVYWDKMTTTMVGQVFHHPEGQKKWLSKYSAKLPFLIPVVTIDGLFISFDKTKIKHTFDETIGKFHFYDHLFCVPNYLDGIKIGVTSSFEITHESVGQPNQEFWESKDNFLEKWGSKLPLDLKPESVYVPSLKIKPIKPDGKVAIIIPTLGNVEMLYNCVKSFYDNCDKNLFDVFIADTGSSETDKNYIKNNILPLGTIKLIEYDYYNFSKINNDVVKNYIGNDYSYLLFSNNDIKILNNVIYHMVKLFKTKKNIGTVGCRLHYGDNTLQHDSIDIVINTRQKAVRVVHFKKESYYNYNIMEKEVAGNTAGLMMIKKDIFNKFGGFDERFRHCFEDVYLNLNLIKNNFINYNLGYCVGYHYESTTRDVNETSAEMMEDFNKHILTFITEKENFDKLTKYILNEN